MDSVFLTERKRQREVIATADSVIENTDKMMQARTDLPPNMRPSITATQRQLDVSPQQEVVLNVEWVAAAILFAQQHGESINPYMGLITVISDHVNSRAQARNGISWQQVVRSTVSDEELAELIIGLLDAL